MTSIERAEFLLRKFLRSIEILSIFVTSFSPLNWVKIMSMRLFGAKIGREVSLYHGLHARAVRRLSIGSDVFIAEDVVLDARGGLSIGSHVSINTGVQIWTAQHDWKSDSFAYVSAPIVIGDRAWISARAILLPGVSIGDGAVVAAGSVVTKDVPPWVLVAGNPARYIRDRPVVNEYRLDATANKVWWW